MNRKWMVGVLVAGCALGGAALAGAAGAAGAAEGVEGQAIPERPGAVVPGQEPRGDAATFEVYKDRAGEYRWRLRAKNTQVLATSGEGYAEKRSCLNAIESVRKAAVDAAVEEMVEGAK